MFNSELTREQIKFRDTVRDFVTHEIKPVAHGSERLQDLSRPLPLDLIDKAARIGLRTLALSESAGGAGADNLTSCVVMEELAAGDVDVAMPLAQTSTLAAALFDRAMTKEQRALYLPRFMEDDRYHLAFAAAETESDQYHRAVDATPASGITAVRRGSQWVLNGTSGFVANASIAKLAVVQAHTQDRALVTLLVPIDAAGVTARDNPCDAETVHWYHGVGGELVFSDCKIAHGNEIAPGNARTVSSLGVSHPQLSAMALGIGREAFEAVLAYAKLRVQGGRPIIQHQAIGTMLANIAIGLSVARDAVWHAAWALDHPDRLAEYSGFDLPLGRIAYVHTAEAVYRATEEAVECFGAMGVMIDMPLAKFMRDARVFLLAGESAAMAKFRIAEALAGYGR